MGILVMKRLLTIGGLLAGLSGCVNGVVESNLEREVSGVPALGVAPHVKGPERVNPYFLGLDDKRLQGLREFYLDSRNLKIKEGDISGNRVLLSVGGADGSLGHGYLINDCGLVLTASHVVRDLNQHGLSNGEITTMDGSVYPIRGTELEDEFLDFAIVSAETGMESKTHPLRFTDTLFSPCGSDASFMAVDFTAHGELTYDSFSGKVLCVEDMLKEMEKDNGIRHKGLFLGMLLRKGFVFLDVDLKYGYSGAPVFGELDSEEPIFLGLVQGGLGERDHRFDSYELIDGFTAITSSSRILDGIGVYLREQGALDRIWNLPR